MSEDTQPIDVDLIEDSNEELFEHYRIVADKGQSLLRVDKFLMNRIENVSRNRIQQAAKAGNILVNEQVIKSNYKVKPLDVVTVVFSHPPREIEIIPQQIPINIVFEDPYVIVVNKQANLVVHPGFGNYTGTLLNALAWHFKESGQIPENGYGYLAHRIDKDTSGLLIIAKDELSQSRLAKQFFDHTIGRRYQALVWGDVANEGGTITGHIGRSLKDRRVMTVFPGGEFGKDAITHYSLLRSYSYVSLVECKLETGRTHQIRAHFKYIGHPIFNDATYGGDAILKGTTFTKYKQFVKNCFEIMPRQALHAKSLDFVHPHTGKRMMFESELPDDFSQLLHKWENYLGARVNYED